MSTRWAAGSKVLLDKDKKPCRRNSAGLFLFKIKLTDVLYDRVVLYYIFGGRYAFTYPEFCAFGVWCCGSGFYPPPPPALAATTGGVDTPSGVQTLPLAVEGNAIITLSDDPINTATISGNLNVGSAAAASTPFVAIGTSQVTINAPSTTGTYYYQYQAFLDSGLCADSKLYGGSAYNRDEVIKKYQSQTCTPTKNGGGGVVISGGYPTTAGCTELGNLVFTCGSALSVAGMLQSSAITTTNVTATSLVGGTIVAENNIVANQTVMIHDQTATGETVSAANQLAAILPTCTGTLSVSGGQLTCGAAASPTASCTPTSQHQANSCPAGQTGSINMENDYTCSGNTGSWSGWYQLSSTCASGAATCTPTSQTQTVACPSGETGSITQQMDYTCPASGGVGSWGSWVTTANTCAAAPFTGHWTLTTISDGGCSNASYTDAGEHHTDVNTLVCTTKGATASFSYGQSGVAGKAACYNTCWTAVSGAKECNMPIAINNYVCQ